MMPMRCSAMPGINQEIRETHEKRLPPCSLPERWRRLIILPPTNSRHLMSRTGRQSTNTSNALCVIMGGGQGSRLFPLTKERSKPAVPLGGKYRIVDIPISNCINSGLRRIYILTQFNSTSLHRHISQSYKFDQFTGGFVDILAAQQ